MRRGKKKTTIITTKRHNVAGSAERGAKAGTGKKFAKNITKKVHKTHKGYGMKSILKGQMTYKRKRGKR
jgi:hypothetical protein